MPHRVTVPETRVRRQKVMILLEEGAAKRIWAGLHKRVDTPVGVQWVCQLCGSASKKDRPSIKHWGRCPVPELYSRFQRQP